MKIISIVFILSVILFAEPSKIYYYTSGKNIEDFKSLKIKFDKYLSQYGEYEFQPFSNKEVFEDFLEEGNALVMLSSLHYVQIAKSKELNAICVAQNKKNIRDTNIVVGHKNATLGGTITTAFSRKYTKKLLRQTIGSSNLNILKVPKEIDALMSVGYGMSQFAAVSKRSLLLLQKTNKVLMKNMHIYSESDPTYKMLVAMNKNDNKKNTYIRIFSMMQKSKKGREVLKLLNIDNIVRLNAQNLRELRSLR